MNTRMKADTYDRLLQEATGKYELPPYPSEYHRDFVVTMYKKGYEVKHYNGRGFYVGPCVVVEFDCIDQTRKDAGQELLIDNMGHDYVLYPKRS